MTTLLTLLILVLTVHVETTVEDMTLVIIDSSGTVVGERPALAPGNYVFDLADGAYTVRAVVADTIVASIPDVRVPATAAVVVAVDSRAVERARTARATATAEGARRNQNIQVNLVDNQALNEALGRQGARMAPVAEFSAARGNYAADLGGLAACRTFGTGIGRQACQKQGHERTIPSGRSRHAVLVAAVGPGLASGRAPGAVRCRGGVEAGPA